MSSDSVALQRDLSSLESWSEAWRLRFNIQKCNIISTGKKSRPFFYQLDWCILKHVSNHPSLLIELSDSLTFSVHIANIVSSACQKLGFLRRNLKRCPRDVKALAYYALVRSRLEYCCSIWDPHQVADINRLEGVQRNAVRFVCSEYRRGPVISVTALLQQLQWPSLADRRLIATLTLFYNAHTGKINIQLCNLVDRSDSRTRGARHNYKYISTKNTALGQSFFPKTLKDWNKLNNETKESSTTVQFKNSLWASHR